MLFHKKGLDVENEYIFEAFSRLYQASYDKNGYLANFDSLFIPKISKFIKDHERIEIDYHSYYCPPVIQNKIIDNLVNEPYITIHPKTGNPVFHKLRDYQKNRIKNTVVLGVSPFSSFSAFCKKYPKFRENIESFREILESQSQYKEDLD